MRTFLSRVANAGTQGLSVNAARHVRLANQISLVAIALSLMAFADRRLHERPVVLVVAAVAVLVYVTSLWLAALRLPRASRYVMMLGSLGWVSAAGVLMGADTEQHLFLLAVATGAWFILPREERSSAVVVAAFTGALMLALDLYIPARLALRAPGTFPLTAGDKLTLFAILQALAYYAVTQTERAEDALAAEQARSEALLLNIFPRAIAEQLKQEHRSIAERFEHATVLFADLVNFTQLSERVGPTELVKMLDAIFTRFDALADHHGLEKIKTIGDAYMVVGGVPSPRADHADAVARMALDMLRVLEGIDDPLCRGLNLRIGIHTGPVVAGVIGTRKYAYDLWGDVVNTASRMESHGHPGRVHLSADVQALLNERFTFEPRGAISVKGKGELTTYFLIAAKDESRPFDTDRGGSQKF